MNPVSGSIRFAYDPTEPEKGIKASSLCSLWAFFF